METLFLYFTIFAPLLLLILIQSKSRSKSSKNLPPGPWRLPIIGNMHQFVGLPHRRLLDLANKYGPLMRLQLGELKFVVISSPELAEQVMKTHDLIFASRPSLLTPRIMAYNSRDVVFSPYGEYWRQMKKIFVLEILSAKRVQSFRSIREEEVSQAVRSITSSVGVPVNLSEIVMGLIYLIVSRTAFGQALRDKDDSSRIIKNAVELFGGFSFPELFPSVKMLEVISGVRSKLMKAHKELDGLIEGVIREHREKKKMNNEAEDIVDVLLNLQDQGKLDIPLATDDIKGVIMDMFLAGVDTTTTLIEWVISELVKNPEVMRKAQEEVRRVYNGKENVDETDLHDLTYLNAIIKETLRFHPPGALNVPRESMAGVELCGYRIPEKTRVLINIWAIGRDPRYWNEPEKFNPERFINSNIDYKGTHFEYIPFGGGRRLCPGILYGKSIVELVVANLLYHFDWSIPDGGKPEDLDMSESFGAIARRRFELFLIPTLNVPQ